MQHDYDWLNTNSRDTEEANFAIAYCNYLKEKQSIQADEVRLAGYQPVGALIGGRPPPPSEG